MQDTELYELLELAKEAAKEAYAPYSGYKVGSALKCADGSIYSACNVENASYSLTICAERAAVFKAISEGKRVFTGIAIYVQSDESFPPCGACRQVLNEFAPDIPVIWGNNKEVKQSTMRELLPGAFSLDAE